MRTAPNWPRWLFPLGALIAVFSCTDAGLQPFTDGVEYVDDKLSVEGRFCVSEPDDVAFPVKILIAIDQSASLQCTDPGNNRFEAINGACNGLDGLPNVEFGVVGFASWSSITPFTTSWNDASEALAPSGGTATDYQGALSLVLEVLEQDMLDSGPTEVARTKYIVLFLSDGVPVPQCRAGCDDGDTPPDSNYGVCNTTLEIPEGEYVDMHTLCPEYNQPEQILQKVRDIIALGEFYGAGELSLSTILLLASQEEIDQVCPDIDEFDNVREEAEPLMQSMALEGLGTYRDVSISTDLDFLEFNYESLEAPYQVTEFFAINTHTIPTESGMSMDSDMDGLDDTTEFDLGLDRLLADTDNDRFSDLFEVTFANMGFDALNEGIPALGCDGGSDRDGDGLRECEEEFLGTDPLLPDSDGDRIPDGIEFRLGMDPMIEDTYVDHDFDGRLSGDEVRAGTHPQLYDEESALLNQIHYSVDSTQVVSQDHTDCYDFHFQDLTLKPTLSADAENGINRILVYGQEEPVGLAGSRGRVHVACVEPRYLGDTFKDPPSGQISGIGPESFVEIQEFEPDEHCIVMNPEPEPEEGEEEQP